MSGDPTNDARILAALRALPPETVADVREAAEWEWSCSRSRIASTHARSKHAAKAARLTALADLLDALREVPDAG